MPFEFLLSDSGSEDADELDDEAPDTQGRPPLVSRKSQSLRAFLHQRALQQVSVTKLMSGAMDSLPERNSRVVRVFISSTFSDMHLERNVLMQRVYPKLKEMCLAKFGLAFQMVDMRWGIQDGASMDQRASEICMQEIAHCQSTSVGPHFLAILSHRYGTKTLPYAVKKSVMEALISTMQSSNMDEAITLTAKWYLLDENQLEPVYVLQPIMQDSSIKIEAKHALTAWQNDEATLLRALQACAVAAKEAGTFGEDTAVQFTTSVTHQEVLNGVQKSTFARRQDALLFHRDLTDVLDYVQMKEPGVRRLIDIKDDGQIDDNAKLLLDTLKEQKLPNLLPTENIIVYRLACKSVLETDCNDAKEYADRFAIDVENQLERLIGRAVENISELESDSLYSEVLQHSHQCVSSVRQFQGREDTMSQVRRYIESEARHPLMIHGASGCGKTSVMARAANLARQWLPESDREGAIVIIRFLGTSPSSSSIRHTLRSIVQQIFIAMEFVEENDISQGDDFREIVNNFYKLAEKLCQQSRKVLIFLDSVDQLDASDGAHTLGWLRPNLPTGIKIVLSSLPDMFDILDSCRSLLRDIDSSECFVEICELNPELCCHIVRDMLTERGRCLTEPQWCVLRAAFEKCSLPIYMNLMFNQVMAWNSYTPVDSHSLEYTVRGAIEHLFNRLERQHGQLLVSHALAYITASRSGLGEGEIEDLLSLDEEVLGEVFAHHLPPFIRLPPLCWTRVRHEIGPYLVEREADEARVLTWYHRQFWEVCRDRYFSNAEFMRQTHSRLADYFLGVWSDRPKPFKCPPNLAAKLARQGTPPPSEADRQVPQQPHVLQRDDSGSVRFNLRKLSELPFHLLRSGRIDDFHDHVTFNMDFLESKLSATSHHLLLRDLQLFFDVDESVRGSGSDSVDAERLFNAMRIAGPSLSHSPLCLPVDLCGRLRSFAESSSRIRKLLSDCRHRDQSTCILPLNGCFDSGSSYTHCSIQGQMSLGRLCENGNFYTVPISENIITWFDIDGNVLKTVTCDYLPALHIGLLPILPRSGSFLTLEHLQISNTFRLFRGNLFSGVWRPLISNVASVVGDSFYGDNDNPYASSENHIVLKSNKKAASIAWFCCLKPEPLNVAYFATDKTGQPLLSEDCFVFFVGSDVSNEERDLTNDSVVLKPHVLLLNDFTDVCLQCAEFESGELLNYKAFVEGSDILFVTTSKHELESTVTFTVRRFIVDEKSVREDICCQVQSAHDPGSMFDVTLSLDRTTAAICFTCLKESMGFLCKLPQCTFTPLAFNPVLKKSMLELKNFKNDIPNSKLLHISNDNRFLLSKTKCQYMFNIWSARDGSFLTAIPYSGNFYCLGQKPGTDFLLICSVPEDVSGASISLTKVLKLSMLAAYDMNSENERMTNQQLADAVLHIDVGSGRFVLAQFDEQSGASVWEMDLISGAKSPIKIPSAFTEERLKKSDESSEASPIADEEGVVGGSKLKEKLRDGLGKMHIDTDLKAPNLLLFQDPGSIQVSLKDAGGVAVGESLKGAFFEVSKSLLEIQANEKNNGGLKMAECLRFQLANKELELIISNHASTKSFPVSALIPGHAPKPFSHTAKHSGVLSKDKSEIYLLVNAANGPKMESGGEGDLSSESLLCTLSLADRSVKQCMVLPSQQLDRQFIKYSARQVALETLKQAAFNFWMLVNKMDIFVAGSGESPQEVIGIDFSKQIFLNSLDFVRKRKAEFSIDNDFDYSADTAVLHKELMSHLRSSLMLNAGPLMGQSGLGQLQQFGVDVIITMLFAANEIDFLGLKYKLKLSATDRCTPTLVFERPLHPHHMVVLYLCESVSSYSDALDRERMCWPGRLVVCDTSSMQVVSVSSTFDAGALYLLPDGVHCISYRLKVFNIETGDLVRDLDPEESVILIDMVATPDRRLVIGKQHEPFEVMTMIGDAIRASNQPNSEEALEFFSPSVATSSKIFQAYSTSDGSLVFNYRFEAEPQIVLVPSNDRLLLLIKDHPVQLYEILYGSDGSEESPASDSRCSASVPLDPVCPDPVAAALQTDYLCYIRKVLSRGLAHVADARPADPVEFLARWLLQFAALRPVE